MMYGLGKQFWRKGIVIFNFDVVRIYAGVFENNPGSMRVLEKNGFHLESIRRKGVFKNNQLLDEHIWVKLNLH